jgi:hypothetical protein
MAEICIDVEVNCACGKVLDGSVYRDNVITVEPCEQCTGDAYQDGHDTGKEEGRAEAEQEAQ